MCIHTFLRVTLYPTTQMAWPFPLNYRSEVRVDHRDILENLVCLERMGCQDFLDCRVSTISAVFDYLLFSNSFLIIRIFRHSSTVISIMKQAKNCQAFYSFHNTCRFCNPNIESFTTFSSIIFPNWTGNGVSFRLLCLSSMPSE